MNLCWLGIHTDSEYKVIGEYVDPKNNKPMTEIVRCDIHVKACFICGRMKMKVDNITTYHKTKGFQ